MADQSNELCVCGCTYYNHPIVDPHRCVACNMFPSANHEDSVCTGYRRMPTKDRVLLEEQTRLSGIRDSWEAASRELDSNELVLKSYVSPKLGAFILQLDE